MLYAHDIKWRLGYFDTLYQVQHVLINEIYCFIDLESKTFTLLISLYDSVCELSDFF